MEEIAKSFEACGLTPATFQGAAEVYSAVAGTPLGHVSPEDWARQRRSFEDVVRSLASFSPYTR